MKIAQVVSTFPPYYGGMGNVAYHLADKLSDLKYEVTVFTPRRSFFDQDLISYFKVDKLLPILKYGNAAEVFQLFWRLWSYQIIHFHYPFIGACLSIILLKFLKKKKIRLILHYHMDLVGRGWKSFVYKIYNLFFLPLLIRLADKIIITSSDYLKESVLSKYQLTYQDKIAEIPNGVDVDFFKPTFLPLNFRKKYNLDNKKIILFVGALDSSHYFKGVNYLLKAIQLIKRDDIKLILIGDGDLKDVYLNLAHSFDIENQVIFIGYVTDEELVKYYNLCDFLVLPSINKSEAFGIVLLEAMACQKPVIATDLPGVREVINKKIDGRLVRPKDAEHLAEQINFFLNNPQIVKQYGKAGQRKVLEKYSWNNIVKEITKLYENKI